MIQKAFADLDLILITKEKINGDKEKMMRYAKSFGDFISGFTGEHVGEPRLLICLYDNHLLHVDIKFLTLPELKERVEDPEVLFERGKKLSNLISSTKSCWPPFDFQWIEDRFWTWENTIAIYKSLRRKLFPETIKLQERVEKASLAYLKTIKKN